MDSSERTLREELASAGAAAPTGDREARWARTTQRIRQRRRRRVAASAVSVALVALGGAATVPAVWQQLRSPDGQEIVLEPAPADAGARDAGAARGAPVPPSTPDDAPPAPPVDVPADWETVDLGGAFVTVPPEWRQLHYELAGEPACPEGASAVVVAHDVRPAGCGREAAQMDAGLVVAPVNVAHEALGAVAADGRRVSLPAASARGRPTGSSPLTGGPAPGGDRDLLVLPGVGDGLLVEVVGGDGVVEALAAGEALTAADPDVAPSARTVRRVLATLRPDGGADGEAVAVGRHRERVVSVDGHGRARTWDDVPAPARGLTLADRSVGDELVAAVHAGADPLRLMVLAGEGDAAEVVYSAAVAAPEGDALRSGTLAPEAVWAAGRTHVAWLEPADDADAVLRVVGWHDADDLVAGGEPDDDVAVGLELPDDVDGPLAPVSWYADGDGATVLEFGVRNRPEGFGGDRWGVTLEFDADGGVRVPDRTTPGRLGGQ